MAEKILRRLRFDNETIRRVTLLIREHSFYPKAEPADVRRFIARTGEDMFPDFLAVKRADIAAQLPGSSGERSAMVDEIERIAGEIFQRGDCLRLKELALSGQDLIADGMVKGPLVGRVLAALLDVVLEDPNMNEREVLLAKSRMIRNQIN